MYMRYDQPPDGGWGWVVTFSACLCYAFGWGIPRGFSVLFQDFQNSFNSSNYETSWIISLMGGSLLCGTLTGSAATSAVGARATMMTGGVLSWIGMIVISQAEHLWIAYLGSVVTGLGFGFAYCSGPSQISLYFDRKRSLAFSIASIGSPANGILMPFLLVYLTNLYSWRGAVLIAAAICLHLTVGGALLRPISISWFKSNSSTIQDRNNDEKLEKCSTEITELSEKANNSKTGKPNKLFNSVANPTNLSKTKSSSSESLPDGNVPRVKSNNTQILFNQLVKYRNSIEKDQLSLCVNNSESMKMLDQDSLNSKNMETSNKTPQTENLDTRSKANTSNFLTFLEPYFHLLRQWRFLIFCLVGCLDYQVRLTPASFIVVHAQSQGLHKDQGAMLLVVFSVMDTLIRPISGFTTNKLSPDRLRNGIEIFAFGSAQFLMFLLNILAPFASGFGTLALYMSIYGIANGLNSSWCFPIISRLVSVNRVHHAVGIFHFICGIGFFSGPPLAGFLADLTGHYHAVFYFSAVVMFFSCFFAWLLFLLTRKYGIRPNSK